MRYSQVVYFSVNFGQAIARFICQNIKTARTKDLPFLTHILPDLQEVAISHVLKLILCFVLKDHL